MLKKIIKSLLCRGLPIPRVVKPVIRGLYKAGVVAAETLIFLRKIIWAEPVLRSVAERVGGKLRSDNLPYIRGNGSLLIGDNVNLSGRSCFYFMSNMLQKPVIEIGNDVFIGNGCTFSAAKKITIGNHVLISAGVRVHDNDGHPRDVAKRIAGENLSPEETAAVSIEDGVWVGAQAVILKGVTVWRNAIIGAASVVTRNVLADAVVAGNPADIIR